MTALLAYLDPGDGGNAGLSIAVLVLIIVVALLLVGGTIYVAVRLANRPREGGD